MVRLPYSLIHCLWNMESNILELQHLEAASLEIVHSEINPSSS